MRTNRFLIGISILITLSLNSFLASPAMAASPVLATSPVLAASPASDVISMINTIRVQNDLAPLLAVPELNSSAQSYAATLAGGKFFAHLGLDGSTFISRNEAAGYSNWTILEENLAAGQPSAAAAVNAWMNSPAHRADILSPRVTETGVGYTYDAGSPFGYYWVQEFGSRSTGQ